MPSLVPWITARHWKPSLIIGVHGKAPSPEAAAGMLDVLRLYRHVYQGSLDPRSLVDVSSPGNDLCEFCTYYAVDGGLDSLK